MLSPNGYCKEVILRMQKQNNQNILQLILIKHVIAKITVDCLRLKHWRYRKFRVVKKFYEYLRKVVEFYDRDFDKETEHTDTKTLFKRFKSSTVCHLAFYIMRNVA